MFNINYNHGSLFDLLFCIFLKICAYVKQNGYKLVYDDQKRMGPYAYKGNQWVGFDDVDTIRQKSEYVKANGFGGGMIWALDLDDFNNQCGCEKYPLLKTINRVLRGYSSPDPHCTLDSNGVYQTRQHDLSVLTGNQFAIPASSYPLQQFVPYLPSQESQNVNNLRHYKKTPSPYSSQQFTSYPVINHVSPWGRVLYGR